jgi:alkaline phosphatase
MRSKQLKPVIAIILILGLLGTTYLYTNTNKQLATAKEENQQLETELDTINHYINEINIQLETLQESNTDLQTRIKELETTKPPLIIEKNEIKLDINNTGSVKNIILLIGDGMGVGQLSATEFENGEEILAITGIPYMSLVTTHSKSHFVTDSAASATALATGIKTNNGRVSLSTSGEKLTTVLELAEAKGYSTGLVTNTRITHATPACFVAHVSDRNMETVIASQILDSDVDIVLGGGSDDFNGLDPRTVGFTLVSNIIELMSVESGRILGLFAPSYMSYDTNRDPVDEPSLTEMTLKSIDLLDDDPDGFFLMVEGGRIDHASHENDYETTINEMIAFDKAVFAALEYAAGRNDTLVLVTADHETGGLQVVGGYNSTGIKVDWLTDDHTGSLVPVYGYGPQAHMVLEFKDNTDIGKFLTGLFHE